ncbi:hypothetical protein KEM54_001486, partial [Ascosphaera aggregata]
MQWLNTTTTAAAAAAAAAYSSSSSSSSSFDLSLPPLPSYSLTPRDPIISGLPDGITILIPPLIVYWVVSLFWHFIDVYNLLPQYRLHTPVELLQRNHVSRAHVVRDVLLQQVVQTIAGAALAYFDDVEYTGKQDYDIAVYALNLRKLCSFIPGALKFIGVDAITLASRISPVTPTLAAVLLGGKYPNLTQILVDPTTSLETTVPAFAAWELKLAELLYYYVVPALQFFVAIIIVDTTFHSRHHRLYVPYAFGALYNHPVEGFLLDTAGTGLAYLVTRLSARQAMFFFSGSTIKTIDDHCGYKLPLDPLQLLTGNNAAYHDIHHQSWGIKTNYAQPFFTFWDKFLGTMYDGDSVEMEKKYARGRERAEAAAKKAAAAAAAAVTTTLDVKEVNVQLSEKRNIVKEKSVLVSETVVKQPSIVADGDSDEDEDYN